jgi:uncharacterized protein (DUF305 family)
MMRLLVSSLAICLSLAGAALAQHNHHGHGKTATAQESEATKGYRTANDRMHKDMAIKYTGNPDVDFVLGMIPHHQGAIDMARVVLAHGKDPKVRKLAQEVIDAQEKEIAMMREWLKAQGH